MRQSFALSLAAVALVGSVDEVIQFFIPHRNFDMGDLLSNILAGVLMLILVFIVRCFRVPGSGGE